MPVAGEQSSHDARGQAVTAVISADSQVTGLPLLGATLRLVARFCMHRRHVYSETSRRGVEQFGSSPGS